MRPQGAVPMTPEQASKLRSAVLERVSEDPGPLQLAYFDVDKVVAHMQTHWGAQDINVEVLAKDLDKTNA